MKTFPKPLNAKEEKYYLKKYQMGDEEAKQILIERNLRLVAHVAKKYQNSDEDIFSPHALPGAYSEASVLFLPQGRRLSFFSGIPFPVLV